MLTWLAVLLRSRALSDKKVPPLAERYHGGESSAVGPANSLSGVLGMLQNQYLVKDQWFNGKEVNLDGYHFIACRFDNCTINLNTNDYTLDRCMIGPNCVVNFGPNIVKTLKMYMRAHAGSGPFTPTLHPEDGTISI